VLVGADSSAAAPKLTCTLSSSRTGTADPSHTGVGLVLRRLVFPTEGWLQSLVGADSSAAAPKLTCTLSSSRTGTAGPSHTGVELILRRAPAGATHLLSQANLKTLPFRTPSSNPAHEFNGCISDWGQVSQAVEIAAAKCTKSACSDWF